MGYSDELNELSEEIEFEETKDFSEQEEDDFWDIQGELRAIATDEVLSELSLDELYQFRENLEETDEEDQKVLKLR